MLSKDVYWSSQKPRQTTETPTDIYIRLERDKCHLEGCKETGDKVWIVTQLHTRELLRRAVSSCAEHIRALFSCAGLRAHGFMWIFQAVTDLNSISRAQRNFWRRQILCSSLYRNPIQASNFGGTTDQIFLFYGFHGGGYFFVVQTSQKWPKTQIKGSCLTVLPGAEERGRRSQPGSFLFFTTLANLVLIPPLSHIAKLVARTQFSISMLHTHATLAGRRSGWNVSTRDMESFRTQQCLWRSRLHSKRFWRVVKPFLTQFSSLGSLLLIFQIKFQPGRSSANRSSAPDSIVK